MLFSLIIKSQDIDCRVVARKMAYANEEQRHFRIDSTYFVVVLLIPDPLHQLIIGTDVKLMDLGSDGVN